MVGGGIRIKRNTSTFKAKMMLFKKTPLTEISGEAPMDMGAGGL